VPCARYFENVHLFTYDIFRERLGFKIMWGCFCWYPFFYTIGNAPLVEAQADEDISCATSVACAALFGVGWALTRGANLQKHALKTGRKSFLGVPLQTVPGSGGRLLCSGWWAISRHVNYAGEIVQAIALALPGWFATGSLLPWLYPLYYLALFIPRQLDDDIACKLKYGAVWDAYCLRVPYRIIPLIW
jgi:protein-S-isoprenylcysteine O-methyltransferase Ste14